MDQEEIGTVEEYDVGYAEEFYIGDEDDDNGSILYEDDYLEMLEEKRRTEAALEAAKANGMPEEIVEDIEDTLNYATQAEQEVESDKRKYNEKKERELLEEEYAKRDKEREQQHRERKTEKGSDKEAKAEIEAYEKKLQQAQLANMALIKLCLQRERTLLEKANALVTSAGLGVYEVISKPVSLIHEKLMEHTYHRRESQYQTSSEYWEKVTDRAYKKAAKKQTKKFKKNKQLSDIKISAKDQKKIDIAEAKKNYYKTLVYEQEEKLDAHRQKHEERRKAIKDNFDIFLGNDVKKETMQMLERKLDALVNESVEVLYEEWDRKKNSAESIENRVASEERKKKKESPAENENKRRLLDDEQEQIFQGYKKKYPKMKLRPRDIADIDSDKLPVVLEINAHLPKKRQNIGEIAKLDSTDLREIKDKLDEIPRNQLLAVIKNKKGRSIEELLGQESKGRSPQAEKPIQWTKAKERIYQNYMNSNKNADLKRELFENVDIKKLEDIIHIVGSGDKEPGKELVDELQSMGKKELRAIREKINEQKQEKPPILEQGRVETEYINLDDFSDEVLGQDEQEKPPILEQGKVETDYLNIEDFPEDEIEQEQGSENKTIRFEERKVENKIEDGERTETGKEEHNAKPIKRVNDFSMER